MVGAGDGLRERKKLRTRRTIADVATRLFERHGFEAVTIANVAERAQVAKMTVTNYFPRKEDLALDRGPELIDWLPRAVAERAVGESVLAAARRSYAERLATRAPVLGQSSPGWVRMIQDSPALRARLRELHEQAETALADVLVGEVGPEGEFTARLVAAHVDGVRRLLFDDAQRRSADGEGAEAVWGALAEASTVAFDQLEPSLGEYGVRRESGVPG